jgi:DnaJ-class molecular chaperone
MKRCPSCRGKGTTKTGRVCPACNGTKEVTEARFKELTRILKEIYDRSTKPSTWTII